MSRKRQSRNLILFSASVAAALILCLSGCVTKPPLRVHDYSSDVIRVGDTLIVSFNESEISANNRIQVSDDGTIDLHLAQKFIAAGKTPLQLKEEIHRRYVPNYYSHLTVIVIRGDQHYLVSGDVRTPSQYPFIGPITVTRAIAVAVDFTDRASKRRVMLIRANGQKVSVDYDKARLDPSKDPQVFPGDTISIPRRGPFGP